MKIKHESLEKLVYVLRALFAIKFKTRFMILL